MKIPVVWVLGLALVHVLDLIPGQGHAHLLDKGQDPDRGQGHSKKLGHVMSQGPDQNHLFLKNKLTLVDGELMGLVTGNVTLQSTVVSILVVSGILLIRTPSLLLDIEKLLKEDQDPTVLQVAGTEIETIIVVGAVAAEVVVEIMFLVEESTVAVALEEK